MLTRPQPASQLTASMAPRGQRPALGAEQTLRQNIGVVLLPPTIPAASAPAARWTGEAGGSPAGARQPAPSSGPASAPRQPGEAFGSPFGARQRPPKAPASPAGRRTLQPGVRDAAQQPTEDGQASPAGPDAGLVQQHVRAGPADPAADSQAAASTNAQGGSWTQVVGQRGTAPASAVRPPTQSRRNLQQQQHPDARLPMRDTQPQGGAAQAAGQQQPGGRQFKRHRSRGRGGHRMDGPSAAPFSHQVAVVSQSQQQRGPATTLRAGPSRGSLTGAVGELPVFILRPHVAAALMASCSASTQRHTAGAALTANQESSRGGLSAVPHKPWHKPPAALVGQHCCPACRHAHAFAGTKLIPPIHLLSCISGCAWPCRITPAGLTGAEWAAAAAGSDR